MAIAETTPAAGDALSREWAGEALVLRPRLVEAGVTAAALAGELLLLLAAERGLAPLLVLLAAHLLISGALLQVVVRRARAGGDTIPSLLSVLLTFVAGPIGALLALAAIVISRRSRPHPELLAAWYDRISLSQESDEVQKLCDRVAIGRTIDLLAPPPRSFAETVAQGTLAERQTALGLIARNFSPEYAPALRVALKSEEPVIRVQAAAVAARVREGLERRLAELMRQADGARLKPAEALARAAEISACVETGLLDDATAQRAAASAIGLRRSALGGDSTGALELVALVTAPGRPRRRAAARKHAGAIESELIRSGDFARLRGFRRALAVATGKASYRLRGRQRTHAHAGPASGGAAP